MRLGTFVILLTLAATAGLAQPPPIGAFVHPSALVDAKISPSGDRIAINGIRDFVPYLALVDAKTFTVTPVANFPDTTLMDYWWKGDRHLVMVVRLPPIGAMRFKIIDLETLKARDLNELNVNGASVLSPLPGDPDRLLLETWKTTGTDLAKFNVRTGKLEVLEKNPGHVRRWLVDRAGNALAALGRQNDDWFMILRDRPGAPWRRVALGDRDVPAFWPLAVHADQRRIFGIDYATQDRATGTVWDPTDDRREIIWSSDAVDADSLLRWSDDLTMPRGLAYETDRPRFHYFDPAWKSLADEIDGALPDADNAIVSLSADESRMIIRSESDRIPPEYFFLDLRSGNLRRIGRVRPGLVPEAMGVGRHFTFENRDGRRIAGRILLPPNATKPTAAIIFAGSDLDARSRREFRPLFQFYATRGYAMVEIDHRGTDGYGRAFSDAGDQEIDKGMPDDITDGVRWLAQQQWIDAKRVAIMGQYDGGILALHTLTRHPNLFSALINLATPMTTSHLSENDIVFGFHSEDSRRAKAGGFRRTKRYTHSLSPRQLLSAVQIPSVHYYERQSVGAGGLDGSGSAVEQHTLRAKTPNLFIKGPGAPIRRVTDEQYWKMQVDETARVHETIVKFLDEHLR